MSLKSRVDITGGPILRSVIVYAFPIMLGSLVQVGFNAADLMVVGRMGSESAVASVGAVSPIANLLINSFIGLSAGVNAVLARCIGRGDNSRVSKIVSTSTIFSVAFGFVLMAACLLFARPMLSMTNCPENCFDGAALYLGIYSLSIPFVMLYNFSAAIIRTTGDTRNPFIYNVIAGIGNVVLNVVLCLTLDSKVAAVAVATSISQAIGAVLCFVHLIRMDGACAFNIKRISFSLQELWAIIRIGAPCAFNSALFSASNLQMYSAINSYGEAATAGNAAAVSAEAFTAAFTTGINSATIPFVGQNIGAGNKKRVSRSILYCFLLSGGIGLIAGLSMYFLRNQVLALYLGDSAEAIYFGAERMSYVARFYAIGACYGIFSAALQAFGYSIIPMINSILTVFVFRIIWLEFIYPVLDAVEHTIANVYVCFTFSWTLTFLAHFSVFLFVYLRYIKTGKVKRM